MYLVFPISGRHGIEFDMGCLYVYNTSKSFYVVIDDVVG
jgi:hypothetical protein